MPDVSRRVAPALLIPLGQGCRFHRFKAAQARQPAAKREGAGFMEQRAQQSRLFSAGSVPQTKDSWPQGLRCRLREVCDGQRRAGYRSSFRKAGAAMGRPITRPLTLRAAPTSRASWGVDVMLFADCRGHTIQGASGSQDVCRLRERLHHGGSVPESRRLARED